MFAAFEAGVERLYPASVAPSRPEFWPLPMPLPTSPKALNSLSWKQVLVWGAIIAVDRHASRDHIQFEVLP